MWNKPKLSVCRCCGQVITDWKYNTSERHIATIERLYGFTLKDLKSPRKTKYLVEARNHFWLLLCIEEEWSFNRAGNLTKKSVHQRNVRTEGCIQRLLWYAQKSIHL